MKRHSDPVWWSATGDAWAVEEKDTHAKYRAVSWKVKKEKDAGQDRSARQLTGNMWGTWERILEIKSSLNCVVFYCDAYTPPALSCLAHTLARDSKQFMCM